MKKEVTLTEDEWNDLPVEISKLLYKKSLASDGFKIINKKTKKEIKDYLLSWITNNMSIILKQIEIKYSKQEDSYL